MSEPTDPMSLNPDAIELESYELVLLRHTRQGRDFDQQAKEKIFREHLAYTLDLVASGRQLAAGPIPDGPEQDEEICGLGLFRQGSLDAVRQLLGNDPGVAQGYYCFDVMTWNTPKGSLPFPSRAPADRPGRSG